MGTRKTLENMQTAIDNAYDSIEEMGGDVPQARNLVNLSGTIDDLQNSVIAGVRGTNDAYQSTGKSYTKGESCIYNNVVYTAKDAISAPAGEFDPSKWDESSLASLRSSISDITTLDTYTGTISTYGGTVYAHKVGRVCLLNIVDLGSISNVPTGAWRYIPLGLPSRFAPIRECVAMLKFSGGEDSTAEFLCHLSDDATLSFYCYQTVTSGRTTLCYITAT